MRAATGALGGTFLPAAGADAEGDAAPDSAAAPPGTPPGAAAVPLVASPSSYIPISPDEKVGHAVATAAIAAIRRAVSACYSLSCAI